MERVDAERFLAAGSNGTMLDVRSPGEFAKGHIPGAVNLPIFSDLERAKVGTAYKQQSREEAISLGLSIVGPKMQEMAEQAKSIATDGHLHVYCWRGGMRSEKMAWLFELVGLQTTVLDGGYKNYRKYLHQEIASYDNLVILQGPTGSGKTKILTAMKQLGEQVLDLEALAHHKGSAFGSLGEEEQPTTQQFQNNILNELRKFVTHKPIWVESESATIGRVYLPEELWQQMNNARVVSIEVPREVRIKNIMEDYGHFSKEQLVARIDNLHDNLGLNRVNEIRQLVFDGDIAGAVDELLHYYDKRYAFSADKYKQGQKTDVKLAFGDHRTKARMILEAIAEKIND